MAKTKPGKKDLDSYSIKGTNKVVRVGDCVLMRPAESEKPPYVARVEKIEADHRNNVRVRVRWYYRPEESIGGRRQFHGAKELFLSDHYDVQSAHTIEGKCTVHSFKNYTKLENVGAEDYFCRFEYKAATGGFTPDRVAVYCKCEMPYNPDDLMVQCEGCKDWQVTSAILSCSAPLCLQLVSLKIPKYKLVTTHWDEVGHLGCQDSQQESSSMSLDQKFVLEHPQPASNSMHICYDVVCDHRRFLNVFCLVEVINMIVDRFHPSCMGMTIEQAKKLDHFLCSDCVSENDVKRSMNGFPASPVSEAKAEAKRRKR
ncbi:BAH [Musa troglodytarum]|uniref:BAH n=1 Tax=Musa troglodytarum TaxID=320322 RepID=A0A9E7KLG3_9LILI|nr:BAH [Musa troglodytarum]